MNPRINSIYPTHIEINAVDLSFQEEDGMAVVSFKLRVGEGDGYEMSLMLPEEFPRGEYLLNLPDGEVTILQRMRADVLLFRSDRFPYERQRKRRRAKERKAKSPARRQKA